MDTADLEACCEFGEERVYLLMAIARAKENSDTDASDEPVMREVVGDEAELPPKVAQLDHAAGRFDQRFRLYLSANAWDTTTAFFGFRDRMDEWLGARFNGDTGVLGKFKQIDSEYKSVLQSDTCKDKTHFVFDVDNATAAEADQLQEALGGRTTVRRRQETPGGYHVVTDPFDYTSFESDVDYQLNTDGMLFVSYIGE